jgi:hypothetical protein
VVPPFDREVVNTEHTHRTYLWVWNRSDQTQQAVTAGSDPDLSGEPDTGAAGQRQPDRRQHRPQRLATTGPATRQPGDLFGERAHPTGGVHAEEAAHRQAQFHQPARYRQISQSTLIPRMYPPGRHRARRTDLLSAARRCMKNDTSAGIGDFVDLYVVKMRQQPAD